MIVELIGPGGVGKTTVEPMVAQRLGVVYYEGRKRHGFQGEELSGLRLWSNRAWSVVRDPGLAIAAMAIHPGSARERAWFTMDIIRRERNAARASRLDSGVLASGPVHALSMMSGSTGVDVSPLLSHVTKADVYVRLHAAPDVVTARLARRLGQSSDELTRHQEWMAKYDAASEQILAGIDRPFIDVEADATPAEVTAEIATLLTPYLD
jgi:hypothetical protein